MSRIKQISGLLVAFISGLVVASIVLNNKTPQTSIAMPSQAPLGLQQSTLPVTLGDSIQLPHSTSLPNSSPKPEANNQAMTVVANNNVMKNKSHAGSSIALPEAGEMLKPPPTPQMVELPLESEVVEEAPEPVAFENIKDMVSSEEPPDPGIVENAPIPNYPTNK